MSAPVDSGFSSAASVEDVVALMSSQRWAELKAERLHDGSRVVERDERPGGGVLFVLSRELPDGVPGPLQRFLPSDGRVVQTDEWAAAAGGERHGTWSVRIPGAPATMGGTMSVVPTDGGSTYAIKGEVVVKVPLIGGKAEKYIAGLVRQLAAKEAEVLGVELDVEVSTQPI